MRVYLCCSVWADLRLTVRSPASCDRLQEKERDRITAIISETGAHLISTPPQTGEMEPNTQLPP